ncbi:MAG: radical SAM protein [Phycisphaerae bacterium]|nr:radical SAM protein [Phycisphaerae bacterium]
MINVSKLYCGVAGSSDPLRYARSGRTGPVVAYNCTRRCNLRCEHCYSSSGCDRAPDELSLDQAKALLGQLKQASCPAVLFSGGEPLLRDDLFDLLGEARRIDLRAVLSTNGTLIDRGVAERLAGLGVSYVGISIDGPPAFHDGFRRSPGAFQRAVEGIGHCRRIGLRTGLRFTITRENAGHVPFVFDLARDQGILRICFYHLVRSGRVADEAVPSPAQVRSAVDAILERTALCAAWIGEVLTVDNHADGPYLLMRMEREGHPGLGEAQALLLRAGGNRVGQGIACVGWEGSVYTDQFWRNHTLGNVLHRPFGEIWQDTSDPVLWRLRHKDRFADPRCKGCRWFALCRGNYRCLGPDAAAGDWLNEPPCYLTDAEIRP